MMPRFIPASDLRARTLENRESRAVSEGRALTTPETLEALRWTVEGNRVWWNGLNAASSDEYMFRGFRVVAGPLPQRFPSAGSQQDGRSQEIRARWRLGADILRDAMTLDLFISEGVAPLVREGAPYSELALAYDEQRESVRAMTDVLIKSFVENFWSRLDGKAKTVSFSAAEVCEWIERETESILASHGGAWPAWAQVAPSKVAQSHQMAAAA